MATEQEVGVHLGVSFADYAAWAAVNRSRLDAGLKSMAHLRHALESPAEEETPALTFGRRFHSALLEPESWRPVPLPKVDRRTREGKELYAAAEARAIETRGEVVSEADLALIDAMCAAVRAHPNAGALVRHRHQTEVGIVWVDEASGLTCKARADALLELDPPILLDIKTTTNARPDAFNVSVAKYGYHRQAAMLVDGYRAVTGKSAAAVFLPIEKEPPHGIAVLSMTAAAMDVGRMEYRALLMQLAECRRTGHWPGYDESTVPVDLPSWYRVMPGGGGDEHPPWSVDDPPFML